MSNIYLSIYRELAQQIEKGKWKTGGKLPSEKELSEHYGTSRETVRKALNLLSQNGYIQKIKGKGSFVLGFNRYDFPVSGLVGFKELLSKTKKSWKTYIHVLKPAISDPCISSQLGLKRPEPIWEVVRVREIDGEKIILDKDYFRQEYVPVLTEDVCKDSIYEYLEKKCSLPISFAKKVITIERMTEEDRQLLDHQEESYVAVVRNYVFLEDNTLFQYTESRHRPDKFRFVDFARRN
ncbi:trehalose operon repressor [Thermoactinomyces mirandus]|uniref:Trehalose operon repressor n=1 Tax=Thermoactinomyces mirandus TaxID=2756294 RepID=A0A7W2AQZ3_9BACL|nr:trehalose operon repressor [Thermoactinomyces mirandus]MBA4602018.1 trehalose operon repressor [Thermoactinomyces mirandus]